ncbi:type I toxin-antitoxin system hok family toxin [Raoultella planticola]|uniref:Type I toxin-antitoxin system hok family toxin n=1 Tax=Raoultella planticola TaxID=575 RepID=A0A5P6A909_RAOPL|nr:type I toxin-antitoxin system hok family toxin [Raoultella planticola]
MPVSSLQGGKISPAAIIVPWTTLPGFMLMADGSLCALNINARSMELNAVLAYQPHKKQRRGRIPRMACQVTASRSHLFC